MIRSSEMDGHDGDINAIAQSRNLIFSGGMDGAFSCYKKPSLKREYSLRIHGEHVSSIATDDKSVFTSGWDGIISQRDIFGKSPASDIGSHVGIVWGLVVENNILYSGGTDGHVCIWDVRNAEKIASIRAHENFVLALTIDENYIYAGGLDQTIRVFGKTDYEYIAELEGHSATVFCVTTDNQFVFSGSGEIWWGGPGSPRPPSFESAVRVWEKSDWECVAIMDAHDDSVKNICSDRNSLFSVGEDGNIVVYDLDTLKPQSIIDSGENRLHAIVHDDEYLFIGGSEGRITRIPIASLT